MSTMSNSKIENLNLASREVIKLDVIKGHMQWTVTDISRNSGLSRTWIYNALGKSKHDMLFSSLLNVLDDFFCTTEERIEIFKNQGEIGVLRRSREIFYKYPELIIFYFRFHKANCDFGQLIKSKEEQYFKSFISFHKINNVEDAYLLRAIQHGIVTGFFMDNSIAEKLFARITKEQFKTNLSENHSGPLNIEINQ